MQIIIKGRQELDGNGVWDELLSAVDGENVKVSIGKERILARVESRTRHIDGVYTARYQVKLNGYALVNDTNEGCKMDQEIHDKIRELIDDYHKRTGIRIGNIGIYWEQRGIGEDKAIMNVKLNSTKTRY